MLRLPTRQRTAARVAARMQHAARAVVVEGEEVAEGGDEAVAARRAGGVLEGELRVVEQLADDAVGEGFDGVELGRVELAEAGAEPLDLGLAHRLGPIAQRHDHRGDLAGRRGAEVALELVVDDRPHAGDLALAGRGADRGEGAEVVHVEEGDAGELTDGGVDVAGHGDVDDQQRAAGAGVEHRARARRPRGAGWRHRWR